MKWTDLTLVILLACVFHISAFSQIEILGPETVEDNPDCCYDYLVTIPDSLGDIGTWVLEDVQGVLLDSLTQRGNTFVYTLCLDDFKQYTPPLILHFFTQTHGEYEKVIEVLPFQPLFLYQYHECEISSSSPTSACIQICEGSTGTYGVEVNAQPQFINWFVDGGTVTKNLGQEIEVVWSTPGRYNISVSVVDNPNCPKTEYLCVEVIAKPKAKITSLPQADNTQTITICKGQSIYFEDASNNGSTSQWYLGDGAASNEVHVEKLFGNPGDYEVMLISGPGCTCIDTAMVKVHVLDALSPTLTCVGTTCPAEVNTYQVENSCNETVWTVSANGTIVDGGGLSDDFITVEWDNGPYGIITVLGQNCPPGYCPEPTVVKIPVISSDGPITGEDVVCKGEVVVYFAPYFQGTEYTWTVSSGGYITNTDHNKATIAWNYVNAPDDNQWVQVVYDNCYLDCGGQATLPVRVRGRYHISGATSWCANDQLAFDAQSSNGTSKVPCQWSILDSLNRVIHQSSSPTADFQPGINLSPGKYTVVAQADQADYCDFEQTIDITITDLPPPPKGIIVDTQVCKYALHEFDIDQYDPNYIPLWEIQDGSMVSTFENTGSLKYAFQTDGPYQVSLSYKDVGPLGCISEKVSIPLLPFAFNINGDVEACKNQSTVYKVDAAKNDHIKWSIQPSDAGEIQSGQGEDQVEVFWKSEGTHQLIVEQCGTQGSINVNVNPKPQPTVVAPAFVCEGEVAPVSTTQLFSSIEWKDENGSVVERGQNVNLPAGYYIVEVVDQNGCAQEESFSIHSRPKPDAIISYDKARAFCENEPFSPKILFATTDGNYHYQWYYENAPTGGDSPTLKANRYGRYHCMVTNEFGCVNRSNDLVLIEDCNNNAGGVCTGGQCNNISCPTGFNVMIEEQTVDGHCNKKKFRNTTPGKVDIYNWYIEDLRNNSWTVYTQAEPTHTFNAAGYHMVILDAYVEHPSVPGVYCWTNSIEIVKIPLAAWFIADPACVGEPLQFEDLTTYLPNETIAGYSWNFGDPMSGIDNFSTDANPAHAFASPGKYMVSLVVEAASGCTSEYTLEVEVFDLPMIDFTLPNQLCVGAPLEVSAPNGIHNVVWEFGDPANTTVDNETAVHSYDQPGLYTVNLTGSSIYGCVSMVSHNINIVDIANKEDITVNGPLPICEGESVELQGPVTAVQWFWSNGATTRDITVFDAGEYSVEVVTADGCRYTTPKVVVQVNPNPSVAAYARQLDKNNNVLKSSIHRLEVCAGDLVLLEALSNVTATYQWSNNSISSSFRHSPNTIPGTYPYMVTVTDASNGCKNISNMIEVVIHPVPNTPQISSQPSGSPLCEGAPVTFTVTNFDPALSYLWSNGLTGKTMTTSSAGQYSVEAFNEFGCSSTSTSIEISPAPDANFIMSGCLQRCAPDTICLPQMTDIVAYQWYKDGSPIAAPEGTIPDYVATESGTYQLEITNAAGCSDISDELTLDLQPGQGDLKVTVYLDVNKNGILDSGDVLLDDIIVNVTNPVGQVLSDVTNSLGSVEWYNQVIGKYVAAVDNDTLSLVPGIYEAEIKGCDDSFDIVILLQEKCPDVTEQMDTTICALDTLFVEDTMFVQEGIHIFETIDDNGCPIIHEVNLHHRAPDNTLSVTVYFDVNKNGIYDAGDTLMQDVVLQIADPSGFINNDTTGTTGQVLWIHQGVGSYTATVVNDTLEVVPGVHTGELLGCNDSLHLIILLSNKCPDILYQWDTTICALDTLFLLDTAFIEAGTHYFERQDDNGCIIKHEVSLTVEQPQNRVTLVVYQDVNNNGQVDGGDAPAANIPLQLQKNGMVVDQFVTNNVGVITLYVQDLEEYELYIDSSGFGADRKVILGLETFQFDACSGDIQLALLIKVIDTHVFIPNVFTPNGDNANDFFRVYTKNPDDRIRSIRIFDRWGELVFQAEGLFDPDDISWDGNFNGEPLNPAVFVYVVGVESFTGENETYSGDVTLVR